MKKVNKTAELKEAIANDDVDAIKKSLTTHSNNKSAVWYFYANKKYMTNETRQIIYDDVIANLLPEVRKMAEEREILEVKINRELLESIVKKKNDSITDLLIYQLLNTGRRLREIVNPDMWIEKGELYSNLLKGSANNFKIFTLDGDAQGTYNDIMEIKNSVKEKNTSMKISRKLKGTGITAKTLRSIYIALIHKFYNPKNIVIGQIASTYLGHKGYSSAVYYTPVVYEGPNPFD